MYVFGQDSYGQLGLGFASFNDTYTPTLLRGFTNVTHLSAGGYCSMVVGMPR